MKYRCTAKTPVVVLLNGELEQVAPGQIIEGAYQPTGHFVVVKEEPKPIKKTVKKTTKRVIKNAYPTETSSVR